MGGHANRKSQVHNAFSSVVKVGSSSLGCLLTKGLVVTRWLQGDELAGFFLLVQEERSLNQLGYATS